MVTQAGSLAADIVVATYRRTNTLYECIERISRQLETGDRLFCVVQGVPCVRSVPHATVLYSAPPNLPQARNRGWRAGVNPVVAFCDDDALVEDGWLAAHRAAYHDSAVCGVGGYLDDPLFTDPTAPPSRFDRTTGNLVQNGRCRRAGPLLSGIGANMSFRRTALEQLGGFDEQYRFSALYEEVDLFFRLHQRGYSVRFEPAARAVHRRIDQGGCRIEGSVKKVFSLFYNTAYFAAKVMPVDWTRSWYRFWKYRLEYETRRTKGGHSVVRGGAGVLGALYGLIRWLVFSRKRIYGPRFAAALAAHQLHNNGETRGEKAGRHG